MKKDTLRSPWLHSFAKARAISVLPVPTQEIKPHNSLIPLKIVFPKFWRLDWTASSPSQKHASSYFLFTQVHEVFLPGGPWKRTPLGGWIWNFSNTSLYSIGNTTISLRQRMWLSRPPTWQNRILRSSDIGSTSANVDTICLWSPGPHAWLLDPGIAVALKFNGRHLRMRNYCQCHDP